jgi:hypothetical protein
VAGRPRKHAVGPVAKSSSFNGLTGGTHLTTGFTLDVTDDNATLWIFARTVHYTMGLPHIHHRKRGHFSLTDHKKNQRQRGFPSFGRKRGFRVSLKARGTFVRHRHVSSLFTYQAFGFPLLATISETRILVFQFVRECKFSFSRCKN